MSVTPSPTTITYEQLMALFLEERKKDQEAMRVLREQMKETDRRIANLGDRVGQLVESMVAGGIVRLFKELNYPFNDCSRNHEFAEPAINIYGEIDLFLENSNIALLVEVKTRLSIDDVKDHIERMQKFRAVADYRKDKRRFIAAVGGGVVQKNVQDFASKQGMYVVQQSGDNVEVIAPDGEPMVW